MFTSLILIPPRASVWTFEWINLKDCFKAKITLQSMDHDNNEEFYYDFGLH